MNLANLDRLQWLLLGVAIAALGLVWVAFAEGGSDQVNSSHAEPRYDVDALDMSLDQIAERWNDAEQQTIGFGFQDAVAGITAAPMNQDSTTTENTIQTLLDAYFNPPEPSSRRDVALIALLASVGNLGELGAYLTGFDDTSDQVVVDVDLIDSGSQEAVFDLSLNSDRTAWQCEWLWFSSSSPNAGYFNLAECSSR